MAAPADKPTDPSPAAPPTPAFPRLASAVLLHHAPDGDHYDWLIEDPRQFGAITPLWTARVANPPSAWHALRQWSIEIIPHHRRDFLTFQGDLTENRGSVVRVDQGTCDAIAWEKDAIEVAVTLQSFHGRVRMTPGVGARWNAAVVGETQA